MPALSKTDEVKLLTHVLECSPQPGGWSQVLDFIDTRLNCRSFLAEFDSSGNPTPNFGGHQPAQQLGALLEQIQMESGRGTLQFLLSEASLFYPYSATALSSRKDDDDRRADTPHEPDVFPNHSSTAGQPPAGQDRLDLVTKSFGLVSPVWRTGRSTILFACVFTGYAPGTVDGAIANETFKTIVSALAPGLNTYFQLEKERARIESHSILLSALDSPAILIDADRDILVHTPNGLEALVGLGVAAPRGAKLIPTNKQIENGLQMLLAAAEGELSTPAPPSHSVYVTTETGSLRRVSMKTVTSPAPKDGGAARPYFLIRVWEPAALPEAVETVLQHHYDLSQSEAHLARHLTMSGSMNITSDQLGITRNTAKTHLRRIYEKTGVHTQLQLAGLVHKLAGLF